MGLLILEREVGEWVHVGPDINVLLHDVRGKKAWLGFDAPRDIEIVRDDAAITTQARGPRLGLTEEQCHHIKTRLAYHGYTDITSSNSLFESLDQYITGGQ